MIEIIYDKNENIIENSDLAGIRLPKNFRQIGSPSGNRRIYMEDYVVTYLNQLARPGNTYSRGAILLGEYKRNDSGEVIFISGALEALNFELDLDETTFTNDTWSEIYENVKKYFCDLEVVGWCLSRMGFGIEINDKMIKTHLDNFSGRDKALFLIDSLEQEDAFYLYEQGTLKKQPGYYIYYVKNEDMQNYMIDNSKQEVNEQEDLVVKKDGELIKNYREILNSKKEKTLGKGPNQFLYIASSFLTLAILALGVTVLKNYDRMKAIEISLNRMNIVTEGENTSETEITNVSANVTTTESVSSEENTEASQDSTDASIDDTSTTAPTEESNSSNSEENPMPVISNGNPTYYTVKDGDTLSSISKEMYQSAQYVDDILSANGINDPDSIYVGQQIIIPTIN